MKKLVCFTLILCLLPVMALCDEFMVKYNSLAGAYGAPKLDESMITESNGTRTVYSMDGLNIVFCAVNSEKYNSSAVIGKDSADFLPCCVCAALSLNPSTDEITKSFGILLHEYLTVRSGKEDSGLGFFGGLVFNIKREGDNLRFVVGEI